MKRTAINRHHSSDLARRTRLRRTMMRATKPRFGSVRYYEKILDSLCAQINKMRSLHRCVQCGSTYMIDCGHIYTRKLRATRWDIAEDGNCHAQCRACNTRHIVRPELYLTWYAEKFGAPALTALHDRAYSGKTFSIDELKALVAEYKAKLNELRLFDSLNSEVREVEEFEIYKGMHT